METQSSLSQILGKAEESYLLPPIANVAQTHQFSHVINVKIFKSRAIIFL